MNPSGPLARRDMTAALRALGVEPPSGFTERVLDRVGLGATADRYVMVDGPVGPLYVAFNARGICHVVTAGVVGDEPGGFEERHRARFGRGTRPAGTPPTGLDAALRSGRSHQLAYDLGGLTGFERAVLRKALDIPAGECRPYAWVAHQIGRPRAVRAVGSALGRNPVPVLIPCHRVVRSDGRIGEYALGPELKARLLEAEGVDLEATAALARAGARYLGSDTTHVYCFPTCRTARRIGPAHQVRFRGSAEAEAAGYRPCRNCQPAKWGA